MKTETQRIAILVSSLGGGGAQRAMVLLANGLAEQGLQVDLLAMQAEGPFKAALSPCVRLIDLQCRRALASILPLQRYLREARPDALISALDYVNVLAVWARRLSGVPVLTIVTEQNTPSVVADQAHKRRGRWATRRLIPRFYPWADRVVAVSDGVRADLIENFGIADSEVSVIFHPVVGPALHEAAAKPLDDPWFAPGAPPVVVSVGRLSHQKDQELLIEAFARVLDKHDARLLILGEGPLRGPLEECVERLGLQERVRLPGFAENPYAYLSRAAVFALSSRCEGLPTVVIEALACGANVVSTDCPSGPKEILDSGRHGRLVPVGELDPLAQALCDALAEGRQPVSEEATDAYRIDKVSKRYLELIGALESARH